MENKKITPRIFKSFQKILLDFHPEWEYNLYSDEECRAIIKDQFPKILQIYDSYQHAVQRADLFRILVVYLKGGFYLDLDIECLKPLDDLCVHNCIFAEEKTLTPEQGIEYGNINLLRVANYMFGSQKKHPFLMEIIETMMQSYKREIISNNDILESTGPGLLTNVFHKFKHKYNDLITTKYYLQRKNMCLWSTYMSIWRLCCSLSCRLVAFRAS